MDMRANKKRDKPGFFRKTYKECWSYLKETKNYIYSTLGLLILFFLMGFMFPVFFVEQIKDIIRNILEKTVGLNGLPLILFILKNNLLVSVISIFSGIILGIIPILLITGNGYIVGFVSNAVSSVEGVSVLWRLLPHGIFEIPAIVISVALGIKFGFSVFYKDPAKEIVKSFWSSVKILIFIIIPLLVIAAIIEGLLINLLS
jgi:stage II sporulation protein M